MPTDGPKASLDLTHVLYDDDSYFSFLLALITLTPILLMPAYAALCIQSRELTIILMWAGQFACEGFNWILKRAIKQDRPDDGISGYGFPSSHAQYMGYFASFLACHLFFRHRFGTTGSPTIDRLIRVLIYVGLALWTGVVAYSRYYLSYHTPHQIIWGLIIGVLCGTSYYILVEFIPRRFKTTYFGRFRRWLLNNDVSHWVMLRDGWAVWSDAGAETEWVRWKIEWDARCRAVERLEMKALEKEEIGVKKVE